MAKETNNNRSTAACCLILLLLLLLLAGIGILVWRLVFVHSSSSSSPELLGYAGSGCTHVDPTLNFFYPLQSGNYNDSTCLTTASLINPSTAAGCVGFMSSSPNAWYSSCDTYQAIQGLQLSSTRTIMNASYTLSAMFLLPQTLPTGPRTLIGGYDPTTNGVQFGLVVDTTPNVNRISLTQYGATIVQSATNTPSLRWGTWVHLVATYDSVNRMAALYVNGQLLASTPNVQSSDWNLASATRPAPVIGGTVGGTGGQEFVGEMMLVRCFNYALNAGQVLQVYNEDVPIPWAVSSSSSSTAGGGGSVQPVGGAWYNNPSNLNFMYPLSEVTQLADSTGKTTVTVQVPASVENGCFAFDLNGAWPRQGSWTQTCVTPDQALVLQSASPIMTASFAISLMVLNPTSAGTGLPTILVGAYDTSTTGQQFALSMTMGGQWGISLQVNNAVVTGVSNLAATTTWVHVIATYDAVNNVAAMYINGQPVDSRSVSSLPNWSSSTATRPGPQIGGLSSSNGAEFIGAMANVRCFNGPLSAAQALQVYQADVPFAWFPNLVYGYPLLSDYSDVKATSQGQLTSGVFVSQSCTPTFSTSYGWYNPCDTLSMGVQVMNITAQTNPGFPVSFTATMMMQVSSSAMAARAQSQSDMVLFSGQGTGGNNYYFEVISDASTGQLAFWFGEQAWGVHAGNGNNLAQVPPFLATTGTSLNVHAGQWWHVALAADMTNGAATIYLNGSQAYTTTFLSSSQQYYSGAGFTLNPPSTSQQQSAIASQLSYWASNARPPLMLGGALGSNVPGMSYSPLGSTNLYDFVGSLNKVRVFNTLLTQSQISAVASADSVYNAM